MIGSMWQCSGGAWLRTAGVWTAFAALLWVLPLDKAPDRDKRVAVAPAVGTTAPSPKPPALRAGSTDGVTAYVNRKLNLVAEAGKAHR